jgi:hypothetical protein
MDMDQFAGMFRNPDKMIIGDIKGILDQEKAAQQNMCTWRL